MMDEATFSYLNINIFTVQDATNSFIVEGYEKI